MDRFRALRGEYQENKKELEVNGKERMIKKSNGARRFLPVMLLAMALGLAAVPAYAGSGALDLSLPPRQENVTVVTGTKSFTSSTRASVQLWSDSSFGGIFWVDRDTGNRVTDSVTVNAGDTRYLNYYAPHTWTASVQLRGCQIGWNLAGNQHVWGAVDFG